MAKNIDSFNRIVGFVLSHAYEGFPCVVDIDLKDMVYLVDYGCDGKSTSDSKKVDFIVNCLSWLSDETGLIDFSINYSGINTIKLTLKGLSYLKKVPKSIDKKCTIGDMLSNGVKEGSKYIGNELLEQGVDILLNMVTKD
jgi:hypothetical protein